MATVERRIKDLQDENSARKASYPVAGSLVKFVSQTSDTYVRNSAGNNAPVSIRIKFQASGAGSNGKSMVTLWPQVSSSADFSTNYPKIFSYNEIQQGDGSIILNLNIGTPYTAQTYYIRAIATGSSVGVFTVL